MVISDGNPIDNATHLINDGFYQDNYLIKTVEKFDSRKGIEIYGIGVGLSLTAYYRHFLVIDLNVSLSNTLLTQILHMLAQAQRR